MKILYVTEFFPEDGNTSFTGGVEARSYFVVKHLREKHNVKVISRPKNNINANLFSLLNRFLYQLKVFIKVLRSDFDVVEASNVTVYVPVGLASVLRGKPRVAWIPDVIGGDWLTHFGFIPGTIGFIQEKLALLFPWSHYIALSQSTEKKLLKAGIPKNKITVIYGGVDVDLCKSLSVKKSKQQTIVYAGRLVSYKRVDDLINALPIIKEKIPEARLKIIGTGSKVDDLKELAKRLNIDQSVTFLGFLESHEAVLKEIKSGQIFSLPSTIEGFGLVTVEAMACGVPYVNSNIKTTKEVTGNGNGGLLFNTGDYKDLANKIILLLTDKKLYMKKCHEGLTWATRYDWSVITDQTEKVLQRAYEKKI